MVFVLSWRPLDGCSYLLDASGWLLFFFLEASGRLLDLTGACFQPPSPLQPKVSNQLHPSADGGVPWDNGDGLRMRNSKPKSRKTQETYTVPMAMIPPANPMLGQSEPMEERFGVRRL